MYTLCDNDGYVILEGDERDLPRMIDWIYEHGDGFILDEKKCNIVEC